MANTNRSGSWALGVLIALISLACAALFLTLLLPIGRTVGAALPAPPPEERVRTALAITPDFDRSVRNLSAAAMEGLLPIPKSYRLAEDLVVAPAPDPAGFGASRDPADSADVLAAAAVLLDGQDTLWRTDMPVMAGTDVRWYLDDTIFAIAWKQGIGSSCYSFSEVKIADASQFRRYLADDSFSSQVQHLPTEMARSVNAVTALSGDFYKFRKNGIVVYRRQLFRTDGKNLDTCFVDGNGDLRFVPRGTLTDEAEMQRYIEENDILFSLAFGPTLIENGVDVCPASYPIGEVNTTYSRTAICQMGPLHYLLVTVNYDDPYVGVATIRGLTDTLLSLGVPNAYTLDGGQTSTLVFNGSTVNHVDYGNERYQSDIVFFATAIPAEERGQDDG